MATARKRKKSHTDLPPKQVKGKEADRVKGGDKKLLSDAAVKHYQALQQLSSNIKG